MFRSIKYQVMFFAGCILLATVLSVVGYSYVSLSSLQEKIQQESHDAARQQAKQWLLTLADGQASEVARSFELALDAAETLAALLAGNVHQSKPLDRDAVTALLKDIGDRNPDFLSIYSGWEANRFDGLDELYQGQGLHSQASGNFAPYWSRGASGFALKPLGDFYSKTPSATGIRASEWYLCPQESKASCAVDPSVYQVNGQPTLLTSFVVPVLDGGNYLGMVGVDYSLNYLQRLADSIGQEVFDGQGRVRIISPMGIIAADSRDSAQVGQRLQDPQLLAELQRGQAGSEERGDQLRVFAPISLNKVKQAWGIAIEVPGSALYAEYELTAQARAAAFGRGIWTQLLVGMLVAGAGLVGLALAAGSISRPVQQTARMVTRLSSAGGDLTQRLDQSRRDETGALAQGINQFVATVQGIVTDTAASVHELQQAAVGSARQAQQGLDNSRQQLEQVELVATAIHEMSSTADSVASSAQITAQAVDETRHAVHKGQQVVSASASGIRQLSEQVSEVSVKITALQQQGLQIGSILDVIRTISEQTNLLALNAAIEAARAGEHGRGFAVVADEVRALASKTQVSTREIQQMIDKLRDTTSEAVDTMAEGRHLSSVALADAEQAVRELATIVQAADRIGDMATQIASAAEQQSKVSEEINHNVSNIHEAATASTRVARELDAQSQQMQGLTEAVMSKLGRFHY
ncbi:methyl-accepting chemotaxis protein [Aeromonas lusitana]|uniref:Methyl-accepting chemotaxis protein n=1 Tax=Aeromonas lusitana TaxID=931529 RepID=A0A2M8HAX3_9GAMM|nr:methyl-accepting chemotaxis protein [Aeromonas lusitana]PJC93621.1 methyl-accepting chemotaxis protein [Aeromonas lusitana]